MGRAGATTSAKPAGSQPATKPPASRPGILGDVQSGWAPLAVPPSVNIDRNLAEARLRANDPLPLKLWWFYNQERNKGPWDYKQLDPRRYQAFGNLHYGMIGKEADIPEWLLKRAAGWAQERAGTSDPAFGHWWGKSPYGDDPKDQALIQRGATLQRRPRASSRQRGF